MKKQILISLILLSSILSMNAQTRVPNDGVSPIWYNNEKVGIGTTNPTHKLDVETGGGNFKTYQYGVEHTVNTTGGWARGFRLRNENNNITTVFGSHDGAGYISTGFDISLDPTGFQNQKLTVLTNGNVGIGTTNPTHKLDVETGGGNFKTYQYGVEHTVNTTGGWASGFRLRNENNNVTTVFGSHDGAGYISTGFDISLDPTGFQNQKLTVLTNGNVGIGTVDTKGYKLAVVGKIVAEEIKIALRTNWPDYVLKSDFSLPTLEEVEKHIKEKGHLKDVPSANEVSENGIYLGEMNSILLKKLKS